MAEMNKNYDEAMRHDHGTATASQHGDDYTQEPIEEVLAQPANEQTEQQAGEQESEVSPAPQPHSNAENIRRLREKAKEADRLAQERDELLRKMEELQSRSAPSQPDLDDEDLSLSPDDLATGKHLSNLNKRYKRLEQQLKAYQQQSAQSNVETRLKSEFSDFDKVVTKDNIEELRMLYPQIAATIHSSTDLYNKAVSAYTIIKQMGIGASEAYSGDRDRAIKNASKPRPLASVSPQQGDSPLSNANAFANGLTDELKQKLHREMLAAIKRR